MVTQSTITKATSLHLLAGALGVALAAFAPQSFAWSLQEAAAPYKGTKITVICDGYSPCLAYKEEAKTFTEKTGIEVSVEVADLLQVQQQILTDALTGTQVYDAVQVISWSVGVWGSQGFAAPMQDFLDDAELRDPDLRVEDFVAENFKITSTYDDKVVGLPFHYIPPFAIYRKDIAANADEQAAFKARYGYDMPLTGEMIASVDTWQQWTDMAEFFTRKPGESVAGETLESPMYGVTAAFKRHLTVLYDYERILLGMGGEILDTDGNIALDSPEALKALEYMLKWRDFSPSSYKEYTWDEQYSDFCAGNLFSTFSWGDTTPFLEIKADCPKVAGNLGYFLHPGTHTTAAEGQGWIIPKNAPNAEAAYLFLQHLASRDVQAACQGNGCATYRTDVLGMSDWDGEGRVEMHRKLIDDGHLYVRPNPPALLAIQEIMMEELSAAGAGLQDAKTTIANMVERARKVTGG
ncbi:MAG: extracellular solute-binding protein [Proteobacteria bacterium]|nr:MAG: extracellular solute-binding protein [Pseudomonadota bacterium]